MVYGHVFDCFNAVLDLINFGDYDELDLKMLASGHVLSKY